MAPALFGLVLAGGSSRRMGHDKAAMTADSGTSWLEATVGRLEPLCAEVFVSCQYQLHTDALRAQFPCIHDDEPGQGPLAGIVSAHRRFPQNRWLVLAVDLPHMIPEALSRVISQARNSSAIARSSRGLEPLCGVYFPDLLSSLEHHYQSGQRSVTRVLQANENAFVSVRLDDVSLTNVNHPSTGRP